MVLAQSGGVFEATRFAAPCEISRTTVVNYLRVLEDTFVVQVVRPYSVRRASEIVAAPKVYGFDTGFVCLLKGWDRLRNEDRGVLWEHYVLNEYLARTQDQRIRYWRTSGDMRLTSFSPTGVARRRRSSASGKQRVSMRETLRPSAPRYPDGDNFVVADDVDASYVRDYGAVPVRFVNLPELIRRVKA